MAKGAYIGVASFEPRELPTGYTQREYIESSGTQYMITNVVMSSEIDWSIEFQITETPNTDWGIFGCRHSGGTSEGNMAFSQPNAIIHFMFGGNYAQIFSDAQTYLDRHRLEKRGNTIILDGVETTMPASSFSGSSHAGIFCYVQGTQPNGLAKMRLFLLEIYQGNETIRDYVPCNNPSNEVGLYDVITQEFFGNDGTGAFIAGSSTPTEKARKIKKGYIGIGSKARKIKEAYIGIGGVARPCWAGGELAYYGAITPLSVARYALAATTVGNYALFGGGRNSTSLMGTQSTVDAYDVSLTRSAPTPLSQPRSYIAATTVGNYALFGGGEGTSGPVDAFDISLTRSKPNNLSAGRQYLAAATVGNYALFGGGAYNNDSAAVDAYDISLTRISPTVLSQARRSLAATKAGNYALFAGGYSTYAVVDAYDTSLTRTTPTALSQGRPYLAATPIGNYALFGGGGGGGGYGYSAVVDAYDASLTRTTPTALSQQRQDLAATTVGNYALFGGGYCMGGAPFETVVDAYDESLTHTIPAGLNVGRYYLAATSVGDYGLFAGGDGGGRDNYLATVDAYTVA